MPERSNGLAWKASILQNSIGGSNPPLSAHGPYGGLFILCMKIRTIMLAAAMPAMWGCVTANAQQSGGAARYESVSPRRVAERMSALRAYPRTSVITIGKSAGGRDLWAVTIGEGAGKDERPALAVIAGADGRRLYTVELALRLAERLAKAAEDSVKQLLSQYTVYVLPCINPDAVDAYFQKPSLLTSRNAQAIDDDKDGRTDEDGPDDLDGDNLLTFMRVAAGDGRLVEHPSDPRVLVPFKPNVHATDAKRFTVYSEGKDDDKDGLFNEDGAGGVNLNRHFTYAYPWFKADAGLSPMHSAEAAAVADFLFARFNVAAVLVYGADDNMSEPWKGAEKPKPGEIIKTPPTKDAAVYKTISEMYNQVVKPSKGVEYDTLPAAGDVSRWAYFHYGRWTFAVNPWKFVFDKSMEKEDFSYKLLKWAEGMGYSDYFVPYKTVSHPDFPNRTVETGGILPVYLYNPPYSALDTVSKKQENFALAALGSLPKLEPADETRKTLTPGTTEYSLTVRNAGKLPALTEIASNFQYVKLPAYRWEGKELNFSSGTRRGTFGSLDPGESQKMTWIITGKGTASVRIGAPQAGSFTRNITLE